MTVIRSRKPQPDSRLAWSNDDELAALWRKWAEDVAAGIERGDLPTSKGERKKIASIVRAAAATKPAPVAKKKRGNPTFDRKLPDDDLVAFDVAVQLASGVPRADAVSNVAYAFDVDPSTVRKHLKKKRATKLK